MSLSRLPLPSFSIVLTRPDESGAPVELLNLKDFQRASRRELHLNLQPKDEDPLMKTIDTRFSGSLTYDVDYADEKKAAHRRASASTSSATSGSSLATESEDEDDAASTASSTSTNEVDLDSEIAADNDSVTFSEYEVGELGETNPPLHVQAPSLVRSSPCCECEAEGIPMRILCGSESPTRSRKGRSQRDFKPRRNACLRIWLSILRMFRSLWRRLKRVGGVILHDFTKDL
ncbi:hypothetical protein FA13DRAFT_1793149 [Coprinellus micaceus]|uniref:Uncharacterized protein n=1 Tax=Coprinellus micaceus TaxID=71717 RepID=A0A4Y7T5L4_COPMI|nr:hypothetical protein FA13DRAFT_1793149 [Coprinellus micaceus]